MARGTSLGSLLNLLRAEMRLSLSVAHNVQVRDSHVIVLQRIQEQLADDYTWPLLRVDRYLQPLAGTRFYDPTAVLKIDNTNAYVAASDLRIDKIESVWLRDGDRWAPLAAGIGPEHFNTYDSDTDQRAWPPRRWRVSEAEQIEIWPIPDISGDLTNKIDMLKVVGIRNLAPLADNADTADLDDRLLVLMAAAELMDGEASQKKATLAQRRLSKVRANQSNVRSFRLYGGVEGRRAPGTTPTVYYRSS